MFPFVAWHGEGSSNSSARRPCSWQILQAIPAAGDLPREPRMQLRSLVPWAAQSLLVLGAFMACSFPPCSSAAWQIVLGGSKCLPNASGYGSRFGEAIFFLGLLQASVWSSLLGFYLCATPWLLKGNKTWGKAGLCWVSSCCLEGFASSFSPPAGFPGILPRHSDSFDGRARDKLCVTLTKPRAGCQGGVLRQEGLRPFSQLLPSVICTVGAAGSAVRARAAAEAGK